METEVKLEPTAPPMMERPAMWGARSGARAKSNAIFVSGPVATRYAVPLGWERSASRISRIALQWVRAERDGFGRSDVPASPLVPWMSGAVWTIRQKGRDEPGKTGMLGLPIASSTLRALCVHFCSDALPCTVLTPRRLKDG